MANDDLFLNNLSFFFFITINCLLLASSSPSSATIASDQIKFWFENVENRIPKPILKKLSPLTKKDSDYYSSLLLSKYSKFSADADFCSLAKLACHSVFDDVKSFDHTYRFLTKTPTKTRIHFPRLSVLKKGNLVHLPHLKDSLPDRAFLPSRIASKIPLNYDAIAKIFTDSSGKTKETIQTTLAYCNAKAIQGETKLCPKSLEEMVEFAKFTLGAEKKVVALTSKNTRGSNTEVKIGNIKEYGRGGGKSKIVACHEAFLPFAAYFCHSLSLTRLYEVDFVDGSNVINTMLGICHMDTCHWPKEHVAFKILKFGPGEGEACHWFTQLDLAWIAHDNM
ncbi:hypothetical protein ABFS83_14G291500 [Erythranthe nasuta]